MEIDVDDFLQYPEDDLFPQDNFEQADDGGDRGRGPRGRSSPPTKRRTLPTNEFVNNVAHLEATTLDPSLDWYLRIDLGNQKLDLESYQREKKVEQTIHRIQMARSNILRSEANGGDNAGDQSRSPIACKIYGYPPRHTTRWMPVTTPVEKTRLYITLKPERWEDRKMPPRRSDGNLLGEDFEKLLAKAQLLNESKSSEKSEQPPAAATLPDTGTMYLSEQMDSDQIIGASAGTSEHRTESFLWVDKYKPRGYVDLLSDDGVNRTLLTWLKLWDECVFGRKASARPNIKRYTGPAVFKERMFNKSGFRSNKGNQSIDADSLPTTLDNHKRPFHKIALLSGPPGVGKTTLAHVVARHAGYHVQEMNASDDRTLEAFRKQLEGATQMQATLDGNRRPHCLVIDEIDGAPAPSINYLVSLTNATNGTTAGDQSNKPQASKKKSGSFVLRRPIICICNDIYAPALRELRKIALVLNVPPIELNRLADRLTQIGFRESVKTEPGCFEMMCTKSGYDVRSCINSLQLLTFADEAKAPTKRLTLEQVIKADVGGKDIQRSLFSTWQEIFQIPRVQKRTSHNEVSSCAMATRVRSVLTACFQCGEEDRLHAGLFENYLLVDFRDPRLESVLRGLDWLGFIDHIDRRVGETQLFELKRHSVYVSAVFHLLFASRQYTKLVYPQMVQEAHFKIQRSLTTVHSLMSDIKPSVRAFLNCNTLITDVLPLMLDIIQPNLRPVNVQLYNEKEKLILKRVVNIMRDYNLTYRQQRSVHGQYEFVLEPPVEEIALISTAAIGNDQAEKRLAPLPQKSKIPHIVKQVIAHEIELAKVRQKEPTPGTAEKDVNERNNPAPPNEQGRSKPNANFMKSRMFGANRDPDSEVESRPPEELRVWFRYHEGCNNAIRRFLRVSDLL